MLVIGWSYLCLNQSSKTCILFHILLMLENKSKQLLETMTRPIFNKTKRHIMTLRCRVSVAFLILFVFCLFFNRTRITLSPALKSQLSTNMTHNCSHNEIPHLNTFCSEFEAVFCGMNHCSLFWAWRHFWCLAFFLFFFAEGEICLILKFCTYIVETGMDCSIWANEMNWAKAQSYPTILCYESYRAVQILKL